MGIQTTNIERAPEEINLQVLPQFDTTDAAMTDMANAQRFTAQHGKNIAYAEDMNAWFV